MRLTITTYMALHGSGKVSLDYMNIEVHSVRVAAIASAFSCWCENA